MYETSVHTSIILRPPKIRLQARFARNGQWRIGYCREDFRRIAFGLEFGEILWRLYVKKTAWTDYMKDFNACVTTITEAL